MDSKIVKMRCPQYGKLFCAELKRINGDWKVVNFIPVSNDEYNALQSEINQKQIFTNDSLLACRYCGNRKIGGCFCSSKLINCCNKDKYIFNCIYCNKIEIDYSVATKNIPYNQWAGVSNIPDAIKDKYGNPFGSQYDLAKDNAFSGYKIIVLNLCSECIFNEPKKALNKKGFEVIEYNYIPNIIDLERQLNDSKTQLWVVSDRIDKLSHDYLVLIKRCFDSGKGIYIWGDNDPYYVDANKIIKHLFNTHMTGNRPGRNVLGIQKNNKGPGIIANHLITTGITNFFEGITIAEIQCNNDLIPLIYGMEGQVITAYYDRFQKRALVDGAFTRLYCNWDSAGTDRYIVNAAAWLANIERFGYQQ